MLIRFWKSFKFYIYHIASIISNFKICKCSLLGVTRMCRIMFFTSKLATLNKKIAGLEKERDKYKARCEHYEKNVLWR